MLKKSKKIMAISLSAVLFLLNIQNVQANVITKKTNVSDIKGVYQKFDKTKKQTKKLEIDIKKSSEINAYDSRAIDGLPKYKQFVPTKEQIKSFKQHTDKAKSNSNSKSFSVATPQLGSKRSFKTDGTVNYRDTTDATLVAIGAHSLIYLDTSAPMAENFISDGNRKAIEIANEYDNSIYPLLLEKNEANKDYFGENLDIDENGKIIILLLDINKDGENADINYAAGFFWVLDFFPNYIQETSQSNQADMLYMDIGENQGYFLLEHLGMKNFCGTIAHELQHLINFSEDLYVAIAGNEEIALDEIWLNEGLSGVADYLYSVNEFNYMDLVPFFETEFKGGTKGNSYIPNDATWTGTPNSDILSNYAASTLLLLEYRAFNKENRQILNSLITDPKGSVYSKSSLGDNFLKNIGTSNNKYGFDLFFNQFNLDLVVDSKFTYNGQDYDYRFLPLSSDADVGNTWTFRYDMTENYKSVNKTTNLTKVLTGNEKSYRPDLQLFEMGSGGSINFKIQDETNYTRSSLKNTYYIVYPSNSNSSESWDKTPKMFKPITVGKEFNFELPEGTTFAILGVGFANPLNASIEMREGLGTTRSSGEEEGDYGNSGNSETQVDVSNEQTGTYIGESNPKIQEWVNQDINVDIEVVTDSQQTVSLNKFVVKIDGTELNTQYDVSNSRWSIVPSNISSSDPSKTTGTVTITKEGENYIHWYGENRSKSTIGSGVFGPYKIDKVAPIADGTAVAVNKSTNITLTNNSTDLTSGIEKTYWQRQLKGDSVKVDVASGSSDPIIIDADLLPSTEYVYTLVAIDRAGNKSEFVKEVKTLDMKTSAVDNSNFTYTFPKAVKLQSSEKIEENIVKSSDYISMLERVLNFKQTTQQTKPYKTINKK